MVLYYIYCIWVKTENGVLRYYGHTENMRVRKNKHVSDHKKWVAAGKPEKLCDAKSGITRSVYVLEYEDWRMEVKATIEHEDKEKARDMANEKEGEFILENDCTNMIVPWRTPEQHKAKKQIKDKKYYDKNVEQILENKKQQYHENRDDILKKRRQNYEEDPTDILLKNKQYYETHKTEINAKRKAEKVTCEVCGLVLRKDSLPDHRKSKKHLNALASASE